MSDKDNKDTEDIKDQKSSEEVSSPTGDINQDSGTSQDNDNLIGSEQTTNIQLAGTQANTVIDTSSTTATTSIKATAINYLTPNPKYNKIAVAKKFRKNGTKYPYKVSLKAIIDEFQNDYTINCFKRTAPNDMLLPVTHLKLLLAVNRCFKAGTDGSKDTLVLGPKVIGYATGEEGGFVKSSDSSWKNICRMTADPFPLLTSASKNSKDDDFEEQPLYSIASGITSADRYSMVGLTTLGKIALSRYHNIDTCNIHELKTIVPLSLLRKKSSPWTLGFKSVNYSYNPGELFALQACQLRNVLADPTIKEPWLISDADLAENFKGIDVGDDYIAFSTNKSLASAYRLGKSSVTIVPEIEIDRVEHMIIIKKPPVDTISNNLVDYINCRLVGKDVMTGKLYPHFQTFSTGVECVAGGVEVVINDVNFQGTDEEIINELQADNYIRTTALLINTELVKRRPKDNGLDEKQRVLLNQLTERNLQDGALRDFDVDVVPIGELLWHHIILEKEARFEQYMRDLERMKTQLDNERFLEKVTREKVADFIGEHLGDRKKALYARQTFIKTFHVNSPDRDKELLPEGFVDWEIEEILRQKVSKNSRINLIIPNILFHRSEYEDCWKYSLAEVNRLQDIVDHPNKILSEIYDDLMVWKDLFKRKTKMYFVSDIEIDNSTREMELDVQIKDDEWKKQNMPCTIYYNDVHLVKSYGRNINFIPQSPADAKEKFSHALNVTTKDKVNIFSKYEHSVVKVEDIPCCICETDYSDIKAIIPYSDTEEIMVVVTPYIPQNDNGEVNILTFNSSYFIIPPGGMTREIELDEYDQIVGWCYLNKPYIDLLGENSVEELTYARIPTDQIPRVTKLTEMPEAFDHIIDIHATDDESNVIPLYSCLRDTTLTPTADEIFKKWEDSSDGVFRIMDDVQYYPHFSTGMEFYTGRIYAHNWKQLGLIPYTALDHGKKTIIDELTWYRPDDKQSKQYTDYILKKSSTLRANLSLIFSSESKAYTEYKIDQLEDWSIISPRYKIPKSKPTNDEARSIYVDFIDELQSCKMDMTRLRQVKKRLKDAESILIGESSFNPDDVASQDVIVPIDMDYTSNYDEDDADFDNPPEDDEE